MVSAAPSRGDVEGDGYADFAIGAPRANGGAGGVAVWLGAPTEVARAATLVVGGPEVTGRRLPAVIAIAFASDARRFADLVVERPRRRSTARAARTSCPAAPAGSPSPRRSRLVPTFGLRRRASGTQIAGDRRPGPPTGAVPSSSPP